MKLFMTGATGLIGRHFIACYRPQHQFTVLSRSPARARELGRGVEVVDSLEAVTDFSQFDAVINLAGEPIADKRWTDPQKHRICQSRWALTEKLVHAMTSAATRPKIFLSGSAIGYYGRQGSKEVTESSHQVHPEFTHEVCSQWETLAQRAESAHTRVCLLRTGVVLSRDGGALKKMALPFHFGLGGKLASGDQYLSWIHIADMVRAMDFLLTHDTCRGAYNLTAPHPVTNQEFCQVLSRVLHRPNLFTVPEFALRLALGETADLLLTGQKVIPQRLLEAGFTFDYPDVQTALNELYVRSAA